MAFPVVSSAGYSEEAENATSHDVVLPAGIVSGDLLLLFVSLDGAPTLSGFPAGWTQVIRTSATAAVAEVWYKIADGSEVNFAYTSSGVETSVNRCLRITSWHGTTAPEATGATSTGNTTPNPPTLTPSWGSADTLWAAYYGMDGGAGATGEATAYPTSYANNQYTDVSGIGGAGTVAMAVATRELAAASDDPGTFTSNRSDAWAALTVAVRPAAAGAGGAPPGHGILLSGIRNHLMQHV